MEVASVASASYGRAPSRVIYCVTCDSDDQETLVGPYTHISANPGHVVIETEGRIWVSRDHDLLP